MQTALRAAVATTAAGLGLIAAASAIAQAPRPTLAFDRPCYGEQELMAFSGEQYTAGGEVALIFASDGRFGTFSLFADAAGAISGQIGSPNPDNFLDADEDRDEISVTANDQTRLNDGTLESDPEATFAAAAFTLTRTWAAFKPRTPRPGRPLTVRIHGLAEATGAPLYLHYRRGSKSLKVTRLGNLRGDCGDLKTRLPRAFPFKSVRSGRYTLYLSTARDNPADGIYFKFKVRVR